MKRILIVDEEGSAGDSLIRALENASYTVTLAANCREVFRQLAAVPPDVVLLYINKSRLDVWKTHEFIKTVRPNQLVILFTTRQVEPTAMAIQGESDVQLKPLDQLLLLQTIEKVLAAPGSERKIQQSAAPGGPTHDSESQEAIREQRLRLLREALHKTTRQLNEASRNTALV